MNETGARVVTNAAAGKRKGRIPKCQSIDSRNSNINGMRLHVQAVFRHPGRAGAQKLIAPGRAITADNLDFCIRMTNGGGEIGQNVEYMWIVVLHSAGAMIAKKMIELLFGLGKIEVAATIHDVNVFPGVRMIQAEMMLLACARVNREAQAGT
jgi:hypothetical protein